MNENGKARIQASIKMREEIIISPQLTCSASYPPQTPYSYCVPLIKHIMSGKLICVVGATGNQGGSVARRFLKAGFRVRGLCRNPQSAAAEKLASEGVEVLSIDLNDAATLAPAFHGANIIFSVTNYWEPFMRSDYREKAREQGISCRRIAYDVEYLHGKNIADAAAIVVDQLDANGFLVSTLSHARKSSSGKYKELYHFDAKADIFPDYVEENYPALAAKMSCIHTGYFFTSYNILPNSYFAKASRLINPHALPRFTILIN